MVPYMLIKTEKIVQKQTNKLLQTDAFENALHGSVAQRWRGCLITHYFFKHHCEIFLKII